MFGISASNKFVGLSSVCGNSLRACSKYTVNKTGLNLSPCGVPTLLVNGFDVEVPFILVSMTVPEGTALVCVHLRQQLILLYR